MKKLRGILGLGELTEVLLAVIFIGLLVFFAVRIVDVWDSQSEYAIAEDVLESFVAKSNLAFELYEEYGGFMVFPEEDFSFFSGGDDQGISVSNSADSQPIDSGGSMMDTVGEDSSKVVSGRELLERQSSYSFIIRGLPQWSLVAWSRSEKGKPSQCPIFGDCICLCNFEHGDYVYDKSELALLCAGGEDFSRGICQKNSFGEGISKFESVAFVPEGLPGHNFVDSKITAPYIPLFSGLSNIYVASKQSRIIVQYPLTGGWVDKDGKPEK